MKLSIYILLGLAFTVLESSVLSFMPVEFLKPDIGTPFIIYTVLSLSPGAAFLTSVVIGLAQEVLSNSPNGSMMFTKISIFLLTLFFKKKLYIDSKYSFSYICAGTVVFESFLYLLLSALSRGETRNIENVLFYMVPNAFFTGFLSIFIFSLIEHINIRYLSRE